MTEPALEPLKTERLILREFEPDDWRALLAFESDPATARYLLHEPMGEAEARAYVDRAVSQRGEQPRRVYDFAVVEGEERTVVGRCGLQIGDPQAGGAAIWYVLDSRRRGRGLMFEAVNRLLAFGFEDLGLPRMWADIDPRNQASAALCERLGLRREALFVENVVVKGELCSTLIYALLKREWIARASAA